MPNTINADNGVVSGITGIRTTADNTGNLALQSNGVTLMTLATNNTVTISGTTTQTGNASFGNVTATVFNGAHNGTVGATTPATGAFTTLSASSTVSGTGFSTYLASPPQIGTTTASAGYFTALQATGARTLLRANSEPYSLSLSYNSSVGATYIGSTNSLNPDMVFSTNAGAEIARFTAGGNLNIGATSASPLRIYARSQDAAGSSYVIYFDNSSGTVLSYILSNGTYMTGNAANSPTNLGTGNAGNVYVDASGILYKSTSSLKYKNDVKDAYYGLQELLKLRPVTYKGNNDGDKVFGGLIAEEVDAAGLKEFVVYKDDDGTPDGLAYSNMVSLCIKAIQELNAKVEAQAAEIDALKAGI